MNLDRTGKRSRQYLGCLLVWFISTHAFGAQIAWNAAQDTAGASDISTTGTVVFAYNEGGSAVTVNGVDFAANNSLGTVFAGALAGGDTGDADLNGLLGTLSYGSVFSYDLGSFTSGSTYLVQVFYVDQRSGSNSRVMRFGSSTGGGTVDLDADSDNTTSAPYGQFATGTFVADGTDPDLTLKSVNFSKPHITAIQVRQLSGPVDPPPPVEFNVALITDSPTPSAPFIVDVTFTEGVTGLKETDFTLHNGQVVPYSLVQIDSKTYTIEVAPVASGPVELGLPADSVRSISGDEPNPAAALSVQYSIEEDPTVFLTAGLSQKQARFDIYLSFSQKITDLEDADFLVTNGVVSGTVSTSDDSHDTHETALEGRFYKTTITAQKAGIVQISLPAGAAIAAITGRPSKASNTLTIQVDTDFAESWIVDSDSEWSAATQTSSLLNFSNGYAEPTNATAKASFTSIVKSYSQKRQARSITFNQSPVWDNWTTGLQVGPSGAGDAPIFLPIADKDYYFFGKWRDDKSYKGWHSTDMVNWTGPYNVTESGDLNGLWATSAEYKDGKFYIMYDSPNDDDPCLYIDDSILDNKIGWKVGEIFDDASNGSDASLFRDDADGRFHIIYEDWSPIDAFSHAWDSPLAGHTSSPSLEPGDPAFGPTFHPINEFKSHLHHPAVDLRTEPTGTFSSYHHAFQNRDHTYEIHTEGYDAFGDWTTIKIGSRYYLFGDYENRNTNTMSVAKFTSTSIYEEFQFIGDVQSSGHPDPTVGFAEGRFYLITQKKDATSPGPWVDGVTARAGVDVDGDGNIDEWTPWQTVRESYDHKPGYARVVDVTPAQIDLSSLSAGYGFQFEFKIDNTVVANVSAIMDRVELSFEPSGFQQWSNANDIPADPTGDYDDDGVPNLVEYALGGNPTNAAQRGERPAFRFEDGGFNFVHPQRSDDPGLIYIVETCTNLVSGGWANTGFSVSGTNVTGSTLNYVTNVIPSIEPQTYIRLKVSR